MIVDDDRLPPRRCTMFADLPCGCGGVATWVPTALRVAAGGGVPEGTQMGTHEHDHGHESGRRTVAGYQDEPKLGGCGYERVT